MRDRFFADFHVHVGSSGGRPVKMAAAPSLTLPALLAHARRRKGLDVITVIDGMADGPLAEIHAMVADGTLRQLANGGLVDEHGLVMIIGTEVEVAGPTGGAAHFGCWMPTLAAARDFAAWLGAVQRNTSLSSQRVRADARQLQRQVAERSGLFIVHHAFTPHRGLYGSCVEHMDQMVDPAGVDALELGLSADSDMADRFSELQAVSFLSNSDAHSLPKIAREYNELKLESVDFQALAACLRRTGEGRITTNHGLHPQLGKYHLSTCLACGRTVSPDDQPCSCGSTTRTMGVLQRIEQVADRADPVHPTFRPPYVHHVPLEYVPGLGRKTLDRLLDAFGTEMNVIHRASVAELSDVVGERQALAIDDARCGRFALTSGGGGRYGRVDLQNKLL